MGNKISRRVRRVRRQGEVIVVPRVTAQWHRESDERMFHFRCREAVKGKWTEFYQTNGRANAEALHLLASNRALEELVLQNLEIKGLPSELWRLPKLRKLVLRDPIASLPAHSTFAALETLEVGGRLRHLPRFDAPKLRELTLHDNAMEELTLHADALPMLERINVCNCALKRLRLVGHFPHLHTIEASGNALTALPATLATQAPALTTLEVSSNELTELPVHLGHLAQLGTLRVANNAALGALPASLTRCERLEHVHASQTALVRVPALPAVHTLELRNCALEEWPPVHAMPQLRKLSVAGNAALGELPAALDACEHLESVDCSQTGITRVPAHVLLLHPQLRITARGCAQMQARAPTMVGTRQRLHRQRVGMEDALGLRGHESMMHDMMWASLRCSAAVRRACDGLAVHVRHDHMQRVTLPAPTNE